MAHNIDCVLSVEIKLGVHLFKLTEYEDITLLDIKTWNSVLMKTYLLGANRLRVFNKRFALDR